MKIYDFINIIASFFSNQIPPSESTGKVSDQLRYSTVITWFTDLSIIDKPMANKVTIKSPNFCNKLLNGNLDKDMPVTDAKLLVSLVSSELFGEIFDEAGLTDESVKQLKKEFKDKGEPIKGDIVKGITEIFQKLLQERADKNRITSIRKATFIGNNKVQIGKTIYNLPKPLEVPNLPTAIENNYVTALLSVYSQKEKKVISSIKELDELPIYKSNFHFHRKAFYSAESVLYQIRDFFNDAEKEFTNMKKEILDGIRYTLSKPYSSGFEKLDKVMDYVVVVSFSKTYLLKESNGIIGPLEKQGVIHMLVNDGEVKWIDED